MDNTKVLDTTFNISLAPEDFTLTKGDIWPDGDAPENPSPGDVVAQMQKTTGSAYNVIREWNLMPVEIEILSNRDGTTAVHR